MGAGLSLATAQGPDFGTDHHRLPFRSSARGMVACLRSGQGRQEICSAGADAGPCAPGLRFRSNRRLILATPPCFGSFSKLPPEQRQIAKIGPEGGIEEITK